MEATIVVSLVVSAVFLFLIGTMLMAVYYVLTDIAESLRGVNEYWTKSPIIKLDLSAVPDRSTTSVLSPPVVAAEPELPPDDEVPIGRETEGDVEDITPTARALEPLPQAAVEPANRESEVTGPTPQSTRPPNIRRMKSGDRLEVPARLLRRVGSGLWVSTIPTLLQEGEAVVTIGRTGNDFHLAATPAGWQPTEVPDTTFNFLNYVPLKVMPIANEDLRSALSKLPKLPKWGTPAADEDLEQTCTTFSAAKEVPPDATVFIHSRQVYRVIGSDDDEYYLYGDALVSRDRTSNNDVELVRKKGHFRVVRWPVGGRNVDTVNHNGSMIEVLES